MPAKNRINKTRLRPRLQQGIEQLGLTLNQAIIERLLDYLELLNHWNKTYNLTAIRDPEQMLSLHLLDSLSIAPFIYGKKQLDVGTGAGLPGLILAMIDPDSHWSLLDSNQKKTRFIHYAAAELGIENISIYHQRIQQLDPITAQYDNICSRAYTKLQYFVEQCLPLCHQYGRLLAMKGQYPQQEIDHLSADLQIESHALNISDIKAERYLICISNRNNATG